VACSYMMWPATRYSLLGSKCCNVAGGELARRRAQSTCGRTPGDGHMQGFGQMWQKTFRIRLSNTQVKPAEVIATWKECFEAFWPKWVNCLLRISLSRFPLICMRTLSRAPPSASWPGGWNMTCPFPLVKWHNTCSRLIALCPLLLARSEVQSHRLNLTETENTLGVSGGFEKWSHRADTVHTRIP
jgi:hypothetical protein